jgi:hypothetical protein
VLQVAVHPRPLIPEAELPRFFPRGERRLGQKRKQCAHSLSHNLALPREAVLAALERAGISPTAGRRRSLSPSGRPGPRLPRP